LLSPVAPIETLQQVLGHVDIRMTRRTYAHLLQKTAATAVVEKHFPSFTPESVPKRKRAKKSA